MTLSFCELQVCWGGVWGGGSGGGAWFRSVRRFVRFRPFSFAPSFSFDYGRFRLLGGGAWFRSVRRFVRFRAFLLRFRLITAGFVRLMFQSRSRGHGSQPRNSFVFVVHFVASFVWGNRF